MKPARPLLLVAAALTLGGCIERKITILSNPEGALVELNGQEIGRTPVTVSFEWYGDYDIVLRYEREEKAADGKTVRKVYYLHTHEQAKAPPSQWLGVDLFTEVSPWQFKDHKTWAYAVPLLPNPTDQEMVERATEAKGQLDKPVEIQRRD